MNKNRKPRHNRISASNGKSDGLFVGEKDQPEPHGELAQQAYFEAIDHTFHVVTLRMAVKMVVSEAREQGVQLDYASLEAMLKNVPGLPLREPAHDKISAYVDVPIRRN